MPKVTKLTRKSELPVQPWGFADVIIVLGLTISLPVLVMLGVIGLGRLGLYPRSVGQFVVSDGLVAASLRYILTLSIEILLLRQILKRYKTRWRDFGLRKFPWIRSVLTIIGVYIGFSLAVVAIFTVVSILFPSVDVNQPQANALEFGRSNWGLAFSFLASVVIAPIVEEIQFRGFILPAFTATFGPFFGVVLTSLTFAVLHFQTNVIIYTFFLGLILALMYRRLGSIIPGIALHTLNNLLAFLALLGILH